MSKWLIPLFLFVVNTHVVGQSNKQIVYYDMFDNIVCCADSAFYVKYIEYDSIIRRFKYRSHYLMMSDAFSTYGELLQLEPEIRDGRFEYYDIFNNKVIAKYRRDSLVDIVSYLDNKGNRLEPIYYAKDIDEPPKFEGESVATTKGLYRLTSYVLASFPMAMDKPNYRYAFRFIIGQDGLVYELESVQNLKLQNEDIIEVGGLIKKRLETAEFSPGKIDGKVVRVGLLLPILVK